jgi:hypothetical protein
MAGWGPTIRYALLLLVRWGAIAVVARFGWEIGRSWMP